MLQISSELALDDPAFLDLTLKFYEHFLWIASAMDRVGPRTTSCGTIGTASSTTSSAFPTATPFA